jgi:uncharacterized protein YecT (DUF1311 family)
MGFYRNEFAGRWGGRKIAMFRLVFACAGLLALALCAPARAEEAPKEDVAAVKACTDLAAEKAKKAAPDKDELEEKVGPEGRLRAASEHAGHAAESCIGVLAVACVHKEGNMSNGVLNQCYDREAAVWDKRLNAAYRAALAKMEKDAADNLRKTQRAWIAWRDASCRQPSLTFKGSMAGPMEAWCGMNLTARQAIWMEDWLSGALSDN